MAEGTAFGAALIFLCSQAFVLGLTNVSALGQNRSLRWGAFSMHPAREFVQKGTYLTNEDAKMLSLYLAGKPFDAGKFSREGAFHGYFGEYQRASNEFERRRLVAGIQAKFQARQEELARTDYFITRVSGDVGDYAFGIGGFPFSPNDRNGEVSIENAGEQRDNMIFPKYIRLSQSEAEHFVESDPSRNVEVLLVIKPTRAAVEAGFTFLDLSIIPLYARAIFCVVISPATNTVIAVYPDEESSNRDLAAFARDYTGSLDRFEHSVAIGTGNEKYYAGPLRQLRARISYLTNLMQEYRWHFLPAVDSLLESDSSLVAAEAAGAESIAAHQGTFTGTDQDMFGTKRVNLRFSTYDSSSKQFTGILAWPNSNCAYLIEGKLEDDILGPKFMFDETKVIIPGNQSPYTRFFLRMKGDDKLVGTCRESQSMDGYLSFTVYRGTIPK